MTKKIISIILTILLITSTAVIGVSAAVGEYNMPKKYVASEWAENIGLNRYFFFMPDDWKNEYTETAGVYWWEGTDTCFCDDVLWPGYKMRQYSTETVTQYYTDIEGTEKSYTGTVWYLDVPNDVPLVVFNNALDGGDKSWDNFDEDRFLKANQTVIVGTEYYDYGESENYPEGTESFNNMIYIIDPAKTYVNELSGKNIYEGEWYYYHGGNKWDTALNPTYGGVDGETPAEPITPDEPTTIMFEQPTEWEDVEQIYCHIWAINDDGSVEWPSWKTKKEKMTDNGDGTWSYDITTIGTDVINPNKGVNYAVVFATDTGIQTYDLLFDYNCLGDTVYITGESYTGPSDSEKVLVEARWRKSILGPQKRILVNGDDVIGDTLPQGETDAKLMAEWLLNSYSEPDKTKNVDSLLDKLNVTGSEVYDQLLPLTENYENRLREYILKTCCELLHCEYIENNLYYIVCENTDTSEQWISIMSYSLVTGMAEHTFENIISGNYQISIYNEDFSQTYNSMKYNLSGNYIFDIVAEYNTNTGELILNANESDITKEVLQELVDESKSLLKQYIYSEESETVLLKELDNANSILTASEPTESQLEKAYFNLKTAINNLVNIGYISDESYILGDTDASSDVNIVDATNIQMYVAKLSEPSEMVCFGDVDGDLNINIKDATMIQCFCAKLLGGAGNVGSETTNYYYDYLYKI